jgi:hypothetical protein
VLDIAGKNPRENCARNIFLSVHNLSYGIGPSVGGLPPPPPPPPIPMQPSGVGMVPKGQLRAIGIHTRPSLIMPGGQLRSGCCGSTQRLPFHFEGRGQFGIFGSQRLPFQCVPRGQSGISATQCLPTLWVLGGQINSFSTQRPVARSRCVLPLQTGGGGGSRWQAPPFSDVPSGQAQEVLETGTMPWMVQRH